MRWGIRRYGKAAHAYLACFLIQDVYILSAVIAEDRREQMESKGLLFCCLVSCVHLIHGLAVGAALLLVTDRLVAVIATVNCHGVEKVRCAREKIRGRHSHRILLSGRPGRVALHGVFLLLYIRG